MKIILLCMFGMSLAVEKNEQNYNGPVVYSNLPPPVLFFPNFPAEQQKTVSEGKRIEYAPLPYHDLPLLVYQSEDQPPIHVVEKPSSDTGSQQFIPQLTDLPNQQFISIGLALQHLPQSADANHYSPDGQKAPAMNQHLNMQHFQKTMRLTGSGKESTPPIGAQSNKESQSKTKMYHSNHDNALHNEAKHQVTRPGKDRQSHNKARQVSQQLRQVQPDISSYQNRSHFKQQETQQDAGTLADSSSTPAHKAATTQTKQVGELKTLSRQILHNYKTISELQKNTNLNDHHLISIGVYPLNTPEREAASQVKNSNPGMLGDPPQKPEKLVTMHQEVKSKDLKKSQAETKRDVKTQPGAVVQTVTKTRDDFHATSSDPNSKEHYQQIIIHVPHAIAGQPQIAILKDYNKPLLSLGTRHHAFIESVQNVASSLSEPFQVIRQVSQSSLPIRPLIHFQEHFSGQQTLASLGRPLLYVQREQSPPLNTYYDAGKPPMRNHLVRPVNFFQSMSVSSPRRRSSPEFPLSGDLEYAETVDNPKYSEWLLDKISGNALRSLVNSFDNMKLSGSNFGSPLMFKMPANHREMTKSKENAPRRAYPKKFISQENPRPTKKSSGIFTDLSSKDKPPIIVYKGCKPPIEIYGNQRDVRVFQK